MQLNERTSNEVNLVYRQLAKVAKDIVSKHTKELDDLIEELKNIENLSDGKVRNIMLQLSLLSYNLGEIKEHSNLRADVSIAMLKEKIALEFNSSEGTQSAKQNLATLNAMDNQAVQILYTNISKMFSTKLDEAHRVVNTLNNVLIGRMASNKQAQHESKQEEIL